MEPRRHSNTPASAATRLRILSYNIQAGIAYSRYRHYVTRSWRHVLPFSGRRDNLDSIAELMDGFDIVGLQEVDAGSLRSNYINQAQYVAGRAGISNWYAQTNRNLGHFAKHSLGLLSRPRPREIIGHRLPGRIPGRGAMLARYGAVGPALLVGVVHLSLGRKARREQLAYLAREVARHEHVVLMGDFNCRLDSAELQAFLRATSLCTPEHELHTFPSWLPQRGLDHILVTPRLIVEDAWVYELAYSDHLPIAVGLRLPAALTLDERPPGVTGPILNAGASELPAA